MQAIKESYSYSHASAILWSLQQELNRHKARRYKDNQIEEYLTRRIAELKEHQKQCLKIQTS
jgi:uncharacterized protein YejL (UPF0352 family)